MHNTFPLKNLEKVIYVTYVIHNVNCLDKYTCTYVNCIFSIKISRNKKKLIVWKILGRFSVKFRQTVGDSFSYKYIKILA